jgi:hypothetical protein
MSVAAPSLAAVSTSAVARESGATGTQNEDDPTVQAPRYTDRLIAERSVGRQQTREFHGEFQSRRRAE